MSHSWVIEVPVEALNASQDYFIARKWGDHNYHFWSCLLNGKTQWSSKPGIALKFAGDEKLKAVLIKNRNMECVAIKVPTDAAKRWKARKHNLKRRKF